MANKQFTVFRSRHGEKGRLVKLSDTVIADVLWTDKEEDRRVYNFACMETELEPVIRANKNFCGIDRRKVNGQECIHIGVYADKMQNVRFLDEVVIGE